MGAHAQLAEDSFRQDAEKGGQDARTPLSIRVAFVSSNSIAQGEQVSILRGYFLSRYRVKIHFAHRTFHWESEARGKGSILGVFMAVPALFFLSIMPDIRWNIAGFEA